MVKIFATVVAGHKNHEIEIGLYKVGARSSYESEGFAMTRFLEMYPNYLIDSIKTIEFFESDFE